jgi:DNA-binding response OmpR family regulator
MIRVLIVDSDQECCRLLREYLVGEGMSLHFSHHGKLELSSVLSEQYDVLVLAAESGGLQAIRRLRADSGIGLLILTARGEHVDGVIGLECGADDYLAKPFNGRELVARIRAIYRRLHRSLAGGVARPPEYLEVGDVALDEGARTCRRGGELVDLTTAEFDLLSLFLRRSGRVIHRKELLKLVLDHEYSPCDRSIDVHVSNLRRKLGELPDGSRRIRGVRNVGYAYASPGRGSLAHKAQSVGDRSYLGHRAVPSYGSRTDASSKLAVDRMGLATRDHVDETYEL